MTPAADSAARSALDAAGAIAGVDTVGATLIRASENVLYRLAGGVVARVARPGQEDAAAKEVAVSRWLTSIRFPVVELVPGVDEPVVVEQRAVTFWRELPPHRPGTPAQVGATLRQLHGLAMPPDLQLPTLDPLVRLDSRIRAARLLDSDDRRWLWEHLDELADAWAALPSGLPWCAVHGDAWGGNIVATDSGVVVLDLERFAYGPPEWDLTAIAVDFENFGDMSAQQWRDVCDGYGLDVTTWAGYETLRAIRELRKVTFAFQIADADPHAEPQARYRLACVQGQAGPRPWHWKGVA
ncbi:aminoglycoside phosphotransferase family protein [Dactylosporangium vinaceum]|uniref:Phosphotransferase enzyme family protein n=1 Tax=Dactylosporangium vinaceum TaxID=53362 RepID=A0ABV5MQS0_9ACTN|nr:aminoglycoside phosphotransferase family protein [Dactylosporangium vinaceum]UAB96367.1 aminoglycoside phosphotransferase family protein [Dactylosporangium vinaceum]